MLGFEYRTEVLAHTAWDFYLDRDDRESFLDRLGTGQNCFPEELRLRQRNGTPRSGMWLAVWMADRSCFRERQ